MSVAQWEANESPWEGLDSNFSPSPGPGSPGLQKGACIQDRYMSGLLTLQTESPGRPGSERWTNGCNSWARMLGASLRFSTSIPSHWGRGLPKGSLSVHISPFYLESGLYSTFPLECKLQEGKDISTAPGKHLAHGRCSINVC